MPYYFDYQIELSDSVERWDMLEEIWHIIDTDLTGVSFETREEAIGQKYNKTVDSEGNPVGIAFVARYRETDDRENLRLFFEKGLEALKLTKLGIEKREFDSSFLFHWSVLTSCHGFVCAAMMAVGDDMQSRRAGEAGRIANSVESQQQWFAHYYLRERPKYKNRAEVEERIERLLHAITDGNIAVIEPDQFPWFDKFLSLEEEIQIAGGETVPNPRLGKLTKSFHEDTPSIKRMKELVKLPTDGLPALDLKVPHPKGG